jgi:hypothetical protein
MNPFSIGLVCTLSIIWFEAKSVFVIYLSVEPVFAEYKGRVAALRARRREQAGKEKAKHATAGKVAEEVVAKRNPLCQAGGAVAPVAYAIVVGGYLRVHPSHPQWHQLLPKNTQPKLHRKKYKNK